jgi:2-polyprenyl-3-methyl-5-hydroxy-6-metoxy-1,4-benzoquinol methylase
LYNREVIVNDFNLIAHLETSGWDHNHHYHKYLLQFVPENCDQAIDIGCGKGDFVRALAGKAKKIRGIDLSEEMIKKAKEQSSTNQHLEYTVGDILDYDLGINQYNYIVSIATLHHLPLKEILLKLKPALKPKGVLVVLDLYKKESLIDYLLPFIAFPIERSLLLLTTGRIRRPKKDLQIWDEHSKHDEYMTIREIKKLCNEIIPKAKVRRHLFWRYSLVWEKE